MQIYDDTGYFASPLTKPLYFFVCLLVLFLPEVEIVRHANITVYFYIKTYPIISH